MSTFAVLYTCFNRRNKTLNSLRALYKAYENYDMDWQMTIYLTDDGSTDGTSDAVLENYPDVKILKGNGSLYWAGGMRNSWSEAIKVKYDAYLLINDDTYVYDRLFQQISKTDDYSLSTFNMKGIYVGATIDKESNTISYGGSVFKNRFLATTKMLPINETTPQRCELGNANIMWVSKEVVQEIGILSEGYIHGMADYDYTLQACKANVPVLIMPGILGDCVNDHSNPYAKFIKLNFKERINMLYNPVGLDFKSQIHHMKKHFPLRFPLFYATGWFKVLFPKFYYRSFQKNRMD